MAVEEGDPRTFDPELFGRLTRWERHYAMRVYATRLIQVGRGKRNYPDDESAASVARQAVIYGFVFLAVGSFGASVLLIGVAALVIPWWLPDEVDLLVAYSLAFVVTVLPLVLRARRFNRYYVQRDPESLHRWWFKPGFDPAPDESARDPHPGTDRPQSPSRAVDRGDLRAIVPEVISALTRLERAQVAGQFARRLAGARAGSVRHPDGEPSVSLAREAVRTGINAAGSILTVPVFAGLGYFSLALLVDGSLVGVVGTAVCLVLILAAAALVVRRRGRILELLDQQVAPADRPPEG